MRFLALLNSIAFAVVGADLDRVHSPSLPVEHNVLPGSVPTITVIESNKAYAVNLKCLGCPFAFRQVDNEVVWRQAVQDNFLRLQFTTATFNGEPTLLLNGRHILPLDPMPNTVTAWQVPDNLSTYDMKSLWSGPVAGAVQLPLQYEHAILRTEEAGQIWVQFDVTGLPLGRTDDPRSPYLNAEPVRLDVKGQSLVQMLIQQRNETNEIFIDNIQIVSREDRAQPYRTKCGRLAMVKTAFDPSEWDEYGQFGTWARMQNLILAHLGDIQHSPLIFPLILFLVFGIFVFRRCSQRHREQGPAPWDDDAEIALLEPEYDDAPPAYADIPIIKIEEYD